MSATADPVATGYTPDVDLRIHENTIRLVCQPFQSHEDGLPEWAKNAADEYVRRNDSETRRVIVLFLQNAHGGRPASIGCLDLCGMSTKIIDEKFRYWGDPEAALRGKLMQDIQGGHGNGGKCYMAQMFSGSSYVHTVSRGFGNRYGTVGGALRFGYFPDSHRGRHFPVLKVGAELDNALASLGLKTRDLPPAAIGSLESGDGFTLVVGLAPKGYPAKIPIAKLVESVRDHPQMRRTLELCAVYVIGDGRLLEGGRPLRLKDIRPLSGGEEPRKVPVPETLTDPRYGTAVSSTDSGRLPTGELVLRTSETSMRGRLKTRHVISYRATSGYVGYKLMLSFDVASTYQDRIYGECRLAVLDRYKQNIRAELADAPLTRALDAWIAAQIEEYAEQFEDRDKRRHTEDEKNAITRLNEALDRWKNKLLSTVLVEAGITGKQSVLTPQPPLPSGSPVRIDLSLSHCRAGVGVPLRPRLRFFDAAGRQIRSVPITWLTSDGSVATVDEGTVIRTIAPGQAVLQAVTANDAVISNQVRLEVVDISSIRISPEQVDVPLGGKRALEAICTLASREEARDVLLIWLEGNSSVASVSSSGVAYGFDLGETEVTAMDDRVLAEKSALVRVVETNGAGAGEGQRTKGYPMVLLSEFSNDPDTGEPVVLSPDDPPVHQRPIDADRNIWWINSSAPLASLFLDHEKGYGHESLAWRMYHMERYIDVVVQIMMRTGPASEDILGPEDWVARWGEHAADIQAAARSELTNFLQTGELPE